MTPGAHDLGRFLEAHGISKSRAAAAIGVSVPTMIDWLRGTKRPRQVLRDAIQKWTGDAVLAVSWESDGERDAQERARLVEPFSAT